jgi:ubiquinone/menaquinone biosynthesis C-methylase UbiE
MSAVPTQARLAPEEQAELAEELTKYYTSQYRDDVCLPNWKDHLAKRRDEDANFRAILERTEKWVLGRRVGASERVLVVGGGTGADFMAFARRGCETHAVEPSTKAVRIAHLKAKQEGLDSSRFIEGVAEKLPYVSNMFDFVWSWTVIEHVQNVERSLREMVRVLKPGGTMFIGTVDYRGCYEPHYKMYLPCFLPAPVVKLVLRLRGRDPAFYSTLALTNAREIARVFKSLDVVAQRVVYPWNAELREPKTMGQRTARWISERLDIDTNLHWVVRKRGEGG